MRTSRIFSELAQQIAKPHRRVGERAPDGTECLTHGGRRDCLGKRGRGAGHGLNRFYGGPERGGARNEAHRSSGDSELFFERGKESVSGVELGRGYGVHIPVFFFKTFFPRFPPPKSPTARLVLLYFCYHRLDHAYVCCCIMYQVPGFLQPQHNSTYQHQVSYAYP